MRLLKGDKHQRWQQDLSPYIDGYLESHKQKALEEHLAQCASCQQELEGLRAVTSLLHRVPQVPVPRSFVLTQAPAPRMAWGIRYTAPLRYATAAAALLLMAVAVGDLVTGQLPITAQEGIPSMEQSKGQATDEPSEEMFTDVAPTEEGVAPTRDMPAPEPMAAPAPGDAEEVLEETTPITPTLEESSDRNTLYRWVEIALGAILAVMATMVVIQWRLTRRGKTPQ
ncbi:MAG: zf-HC2 domain-containing protein [Dehalococcoidia bacterium]